MLGVLAVGILMYVGQSLAAGPQPQPQFISSSEAVSIAAKSEGWSPAQLSSYGVYTEMRYLKTDGQVLDIYVVNPATGGNLTLQGTLSLTVPDPIVNLRGYYWFVSFNTSPNQPIQDAGLFSYTFWIDAVTGTIMHSDSPSA